MTTLKKTVIAFLVITVPFACEQDDPRPVSTQVQNEQYDPVDEEFEDRYNRWIEEQKRDAYKKKENADADSLK